MGSLSAPMEQALTVGETRVLLASANSSAPLLIVKNCMLMPGSCCANSFVKSQDANPEMKRASNVPGATAVDVSVWHDSLVFHHAGTEEFVVQVMLADVISCDQPTSNQSGEASSDVEVVLLAHPESKASFLCCGMKKSTSKKRILSSFQLRASEERASEQLGNLIVNLTLGQARLQSSAVVSEDAETGQTITTSTLAKLAPYKVLVIVSPKSGKGIALKTYIQIVEPALKAIKADYTTIQTQHKFHANQHVKSLSTAELSALDCIFIMGGDGMISEVLHALKDKPAIGTGEGETGMSGNTTGVEKMARQLAASKVSVAALPCGSANGLVASINHEGAHPLGNVYSAVLSALRGHTSKLDVWDVKYLTKSTGATTTQALDIEQGGETTLQAKQESSIYGFLGLSWGFGADVDIESEKFRAIGDLRFHVSGIWRIISLRRYRARLSFTEENISVDQVPHISEPVPANWTTIEDDFIWINACNTSHAGADFYLAPEAKLDSGTIELMVMKKMGRVTAVPLLLSLENAGHLDEKNCVMYRVKAFRIEVLKPGVGVLGEPALMGLDGELMRTNVVQVTSNPVDQINVTTHGPCAQEGHQGLTIV